MGTGVIVDGYLQRIEDAITTHAFGPTLKLGLYKGTVAPAHDRVLADYVAAEADYVGYARQTIGVWGASGFSLVGGHGQALSTAPTLTFTVGAGNTAANAVGGWFIVDETAGLLVMCGADPAAPINMTVPGNQYNVTPEHSYDSVFF